MSGCCLGLVIAFYFLVGVIRVVFVVNAYSMVEEVD